MPQKPMITRAFVDKAIGPGGTPMARTRRALAVVLKVSKDEMARREAAWRLYGHPAREARASSRHRSGKHE